MCFLRSSRCWCSGLLLSLRFPWELSCRSSLSRQTAVLLVAHELKLPPELVYGHFQMFARSGWSHKVSDGSLQCKLTLLRDWLLRNAIFQLSPVLFRPESHQRPWLHWWIYWNTKKYFYHQCIRSFVHYKNPILSLRVPSKSIVNNVLQNQTAAVISSPHQDPYRME